MSIILAILIFSVLVLFHEFGHFLFAKLSHITVLEFSLGMGPRLFSFEKGGTKYSLKLLPLGGSCLMEGEDEDNDDPGAFNNAPIAGRIATVAAGPVFNFVLAFVVSMIVVGMTGYSLPIVSSVETGSAAEAAGLREGDRITSFDGYGTSIADELYTYMALEGLDGSPVTVEYVRDGEKSSLTYTPDSEEKYMLGFSYYNDENEAKIGSVTLNGAMYKAGLQAGDVICEINSTVINSGKELQEYMNSRYMLSPDERLFPVTKSYLSHEMERGCKATGVKKIRIHDVRHSHASLLINQGCDALILADRLGHEKVSTTLNTYSHLFPHKQQELVNNLEQLAANVPVTPTPEPPIGNPLLETMGISYDDGMANSSVAPETAYADTDLPYGPVPKETASGKVIPMPQRKAI